jgi:hypothetical protein
MSKRAATGRGGRSKAAVPALNPNLAKAAAEVRARRLPRLLGLVPLQLLQCFC